LLVQLPPWAPPTDSFDNWQTSAWGRISGGIAAAPCSRSQDEEHF
jgi:hypothetical protein